MQSVTRGMLRGLAAAGLALSLAAGASAQDRIKLADGTVLNGDAIDYDEGGKILTFRLANGEQRTYPIDELDKRSVYQVTHSKVDKSNAEGQLKLANYARDIGLYAHAARHYRAALEADPSIQARVDPQIVILKREAADYCMENARKAVERNDLPEAEKWLTKLIDKLPDEPQATQAQAMLDQYYSRSRSEAETKVLSKAPSLDSELADGKKSYTSMVEKTKQGLTQPSGGSKSVNLYESAIKDGGRALKALDKADEKFTDAATRETLATYRKVVNDQIIELHMHLASHYMTRSSYNKAAAEVSQALAIDPQNERALGMRSRIENAAGNGWRWWW